MIESALTKDIKTFPYKNIDTAELKSDLISEVNEFFLFHGVTSNVVGDVLSNGFDVRYCGDRLLFGQGVYFTDNPTKADQYAGDDKKGQMFLSRVCLGNVYTGDGNLSRSKKGPCLVCGEINTCNKHKGLYDSALGRKKPDGSQLNFKEFVIYKDVLCYPEFIIEYDKP